MFPLTTLIKIKYPSTATRARCGLKPPQCRDVKEVRPGRHGGPGTRRLGLSQTGTLRHSAHGARVAIEGYFSRVAIDAYFTLGVTETGDVFFKNVFDK